MKYNKYALVLVLLASSAFGAGSVPAEPDYGVIATAVLAVLGTDKKLGQIDLASQLNLKLSQEQLTAFEKRKDDVLDETKIKEILKEVFDEQVINAKASDIIALAGSGSISDKLATVYGSNLEQGEYDSIAEYEYKAGKELTKDELVDFLKNSTLPTVTASNASAASRIIKLANGGNISGIANEKLRKIDLADDKFEIIKQVEAALCNPLSKDQLEQFLTNNNFHHLKVDVRGKAILTLADAKDKVSDLDDATLKVYAKDKQIEFIKFYELKESKKADKALLDDILNTSDDSLDKMMAPAPNPSLDPNSSNSIHAPAANADNEQTKQTTENSAKDSSAKESTTAASAPDAIKEKAKSILAKVQGDGKLSASTKESFGNLVTDELFAAIKSKEDATAKRITEDELVEVIKALEAASEQKKKSKQEQKDKEAAKMKVDPAPPVDSTNSAKPNAEGGEDLNGSNSDTTEGDKAEVPFYMNAWIMVPSSVILLSAIGGGVFLMTRKTEDTDL